MPAIAPMGRSYRGLPCLQLTHSPTKPVPKKSPARGGAGASKGLEGVERQTGQAPCWLLCARSSSSRLATAYMA